MNLKSIFDAITPENIKDIPLLKAAMEIFIANLEENAKVSSDIKKIYSNLSKETDSDVLKRTQAELRTNLLDVYLMQLHNVLSQAQQNPTIQQKLKSQQLENIPFISDINRILNDEYFITNKSFKEKIGTKAGIDYAYNLTKFLESASNSNDMVLEEVKPFHFRADGTIFKEMYENIVKPLAHPLGFTYSYSQLIKESLNDMFGVNIVNTVNSIEIRNLNGYIDVFTEDLNDSAVRSSFLTRTNPLTGSKYTLEEYEEYITVHTSKVVQSFNDTVIENRVHRSVLFTDGTYIEQYSNPSTLRYMLYSDFVSGNNIVIKPYSGHVALFVDYKAGYEFSYNDNFDQTVTEIYVTKVKEDNNGNAGDQFYSFTSEGSTSLIPVDTSDVLVVTSEDYCTEDLLIHNFSEVGYYLYCDGIRYVNGVIKYIGSGEFDGVYVKPGTSANLSELGGGNDKIYLSGNLADYTQVIDQPSGSYTLTRAIGLTQGQVEVVTFKLVNDDNMLYFADGHISLNFWTNPDIFDLATNVCKQITFSALQAGGTPSTPPPDANVVLPTDYYLYSTDEFYLSTLGETV